MYRFTLRRGALGGLASGSTVDLDDDDPRVPGFLAQSQPEKEREEVGQSIHKRFSHYKWDAKVTVTPPEELPVNVQIISAPVPREAKKEDVIEVRESFVYQIPSEKVLKKLSHGRLLQVLLENKSLDPVDEKKTKNQLIAKIRRLGQ